LTGHARQSWLTAKICFLDRAGQIFKMWHVVHRPFSSAFLLLLAIDGFSFLRGNMDTILALSITFAVTGFFVWRDRIRVK
jgi:hypothetical protein